jgi:hypothetical protein
MNCGYLIVVFCGYLIVVSVKIIVIHTNLAAH